MWIPYTFTRFVMGSNCRVGVVFAVLLAFDVIYCAVRNQHFLIQDGNKLIGHSVTTTTSASGVSCVAKCIDNPVCLAVDFSPTSRECLLCDETPDKYGTEVEIDAAWIIYYIPGPCDGTWLYHGTSCYLLVNDTDTWSSSSAHCASLGARHIEIDSQQENDFLYTVYTSVGLPKKMWIGMTDVAEEGTFVWSSGAPVTYWNMAPGEGASEIEDCIFMGGWGNWGDVGCNYAQHSMCEKPLE